MLVSALPLSRYFLVVRKWLRTFDAFSHLSVLRHGTCTSSGSDTPRVRRSTNIRQLMKEEFNKRWLGE
jgi:hypothetical protein